MHIKFRSTLLILLLSTLISSCATTSKFDISQTNKALTPNIVSAEPDINIGQTVLWGGTILDIKNLKDTTQLEILAYPLNSSHRPMQDKSPLGRFLIIHTGYLEPATYVQGAQLSVMGIIGKNKSAKVGDSKYVYSVINSTQMHLWNPKTNKSNTSFHFGIGIGL